MKKEKEKKLVLLPYPVYSFPVVRSYHLLDAQGLILDTVTVSSDTELDQAIGETAIHFSVDADEITTEETK